MTSRLTLLLFLAHLLVDSQGAVFEKRTPYGSPVSETALLSVQSSGPQGISFSLSVTSFSEKEIQLNGKEYVIPVVNNSNPVLKVGAPDLPAVTATFQLPPDGNFKIELQSAEYADHSDYLIAPSIGNPVHGSPAPEYCLGSEYMTDEFYPGILSQHHDPYIGRNKRYLSVQLYPFQYNPVTKVLRVYTSMEFRLVPDNSPGINALTKQDLMVAPFSELEPEVLNRPEDSQVKSGVIPSNTGKMLIICPEEYLSTMVPFIQWKAECGIECELVESSRFADATALALFVKEYYYQVGNLSYLLLVGDSDQVPTCMLNQGASDNTFAYIAGNDHYPDILVGRFSVASVKDLEAQVKKTICYEKDPGLEAQWLGNVTGIASTLNPGDDGESDFQHIRNLMAQLTSFTYDSGSEFFDGTQGGFDDEGDPSTQSILNHFNEGTGLILYAGHGATSTWATGRITRAVISLIENQNKFPLIWSAACETGNFANSLCLAEAWMRCTSDGGEPLGAVGALMASGTQTTFPPLEGQDQMVNRLLQASELGACRSFGGISVSGMYSMNDIYGESGYVITDTWILFGDPSLQVRTASPSDLIVSHAGFYGFGQPFFKVVTPEVNGIATLTCKGQILGTAVIEKDFTLIPVHEVPDGDSVTLTVTAFNFRAYRTVLPVERKPSIVGNCIPFNHSRRNPVSSTLSWDAGIGGLPDTYLLYLGTDNPPSNLVNGIALTDKHYIPGAQFDYNTTYYWRIDAVNQHGTVTGKVNSFETIHAPDEDFESNSLNTSWWQSGSIGWRIDSELSMNGSFSCRSAEISDNNSASLIYQGYTENCDVVSFWCKVSSEENKDRLLFFIDGRLIQEWSGEKDWEYAAFSIDPGDHRLEWRYAKDDLNSVAVDAAWLDDITLPFHKSLYCSMGEGGAVCENQPFIPDVSLDNYNYIRWETEGDGYFDDVDLPESGYFPGQSDRNAGEVKLTMMVYGFENCPVQRFDVLIHPVSLPDIHLPSDTIAELDGFVVLDPGIISQADYTWLPGYETTSTLLVDSSGMERGSKTVTLKITGEQGCEVQKSVRIHFVSSEDPLDFSFYPNPCEDRFFLEPIHGAAVLDDISLVDLSGKLVWQHKGKIEIINSKEFSLPDLPASTYYLISTNQSRRSVNPLIIR